MRSARRLVCSALNSLKILRHSVEVAQRLAGNTFPLRQTRLPGARTAQLASPSPCFGDNEHGDVGSAPGITCWHAEVFALRMCVMSWLANSFMGAQWVSRDHGMEAACARRAVQQAAPCHGTSPFAC